uniref:Uncharacterized protein n=1 Tax=Knipowitschia caucasica TaxID=637954 RepID=A0AAV2LJV5_KNICA
MQPRLLLGINSPLQHGAVVERDPIRAGTGFLLTLIHHFQKSDDVRPILDLGSPKGCTAKQRNRDVFGIGWGGELGPPLLGLEVVRLVLAQFVTR